MKNSSFLWTYILTLIVGIGLVIFNSNVNLFKTIIIIVGVLLILSALILGVGIYYPKKKLKEAGIRVNPVIWGPIIGGAILGVLLVCMPDFFVRYLIYTFGVLMIACGIFQLTDVSAAMRGERLSGWFLAMPLISIIIGVVVIIVGPEKVQDIIVLTTGIVLICYGINGIADVCCRKRVDSQTSEASAPKEIAEN